MKSNSTAMLIDWKQAHCLWRTVLGAFLLFHFVWLAWAGEPERNLKPLILNAGFTSTSLVNVNHNDAEAALKVFFQNIGRKRGYQVQTQIRLFEDDSVLEAAIKARTMQYVILDAWQYLSLDIHKEVTPVYVSRTQGKVGKNYLLLTRRDSGLTTLGDLRGKDLAEYELANNTVSQRWLDTLLLTNRLGTPSAFFGVIEIVKKPTGVVLPVFFGKKPACFVDQSGLDIITELNPQVGKALHPVATSEPYLDFILCLTNTAWESEQQKADTLQALKELHLEPEGRQILTLFKIGQLIPFQEEQLDAVKRLRSAYGQLRQEAKL